jgi:hypothetical protein
MVVAVAATDFIKPYLSGLCLLSACLPSAAGVLPDDRADALYHSYDGGGVEITGPSVLVLKKLGENVALSGNYYVDSISSASIDVVTSGASKYSEDRTELSAGVDYLHGNSTISLSYTNSDEDDYQANSASFGISMDMFGNMTTVSMAYARGWDTVESNTDATFSEDVDRQNYQLGLTQVVSTRMLMELNVEVITDEGFLNNPYRSVRYINPADPTTYLTEPEVYPNTRTSTAVAARSLYYLPYRASVLGEYRFFDDTWGIDAHTLKLGYTHPLESGWILEGSYRYYTQSSADFYSDLFPRQNAQNFMARDKELSSFDSHTIGFKLSYDLIRNGWHFIDKGSINLAYDHIWFEYDDFRDLRNTGFPAGTEPLYEFSADVAQIFLSIWF